ncbi:MAG TPA: peptide ABC transporter substrate-binding protein, partial [Anaerolineales bacterium]|nr:peptide ABC transporter substrate-binding protein [Anaerolineales bacterium]
LFLLCAFLVSACNPTWAPSKSENVMYVQEELGFSLQLPEGWRYEIRDQEGLVAFSTKDWAGEVLMFDHPVQSGDDLMSLSRAVQDQYLSDVGEVEIRDDGKLTLKNRERAYFVTALIDRPPNEPDIKVSFTTTILSRKNRAVTFLAMGTADQFDQYADEVKSLIKSLRYVEDQSGMPYLASVANQTDVPLDQALVLAGGESTNPRNYDPATTLSSGDKRVFSGLVSFDPSLHLTPDLAERWEASPDGLVYTFHLRENARFHDGRPVTAQDVVYSWERAASPALASDTVLTYLGDIVGVRAMNAGEADHISGLKIIDDHTLQVTIDAPKPYFILKLTFPTTFVVDKANVESGAEWYRTPNGTGPYKLIEWKRFERQVYQANKDFYLGEPSIPYIVVQLYSGEGERLYESGDIDITGIYSVERFSDPTEPLHNELLTGVSLCTQYMVFDTTRPPFDDVNVRKAFSMAFDRQKYIDVVLNGHALPANGLYPPGLPGFNLALKGLPYDPAQARDLLAKSKYGGPAGLPPIVFSDIGVGSYVSGDVAALAEMWEQNLGIKITVENLEPNFYYDQIYAGNHGQLLRGGWCADYPDPENFADVLFHTGSAQNNGGYSNPQLDALLEAARVEQDVTKRIAMYQQAEQLIVDDAAVLFTSHSLSYQLVKPYVKGYVFTPIDIPIERYMWLEGK